VKGKSRYGILAYRVFLCVNKLVPGTRLSINLFDRGCKFESVYYNEIYNMTGWVRLEGYSA
jgi:hypothetical protein